MARQTRTRLLLGLLLVSSAALCAQAQQDTVASAGQQGSRAVASLLGSLAKALASLQASLPILQPSDHSVGWSSLEDAVTQTKPQGVDDEPDFPDQDEPSITKHWALLIAGSSMYANYRHQSDVAHAYQVLRRGGYHEDRIVVMTFDDIAADRHNPYPGKLFNRAGGPDNYAGLVIDYRGDDVTAETFLSVLTGDANAVEGKGSGKVIASGPTDRVFVFYSDHGAPGVLGMPSGSMLFADELHSAIHIKREAGGFKEMVLYIEACESGSMFDGLMQPGSNVLAVTASNGQESSWGTYCPIWPPPRPPAPTPAPGPDGPDMGLGTCMGDLFSVAWMENADDADLTAETLTMQLVLVTGRTSDNFTYAQGSHVMHYGQTAMESEKAGDYEGAANTGGAHLARHAPHGGVTQRDADLMHLRHLSIKGAPGAMAALEAEVSRRASIDAAAERSARHLLRCPRAAPLLAGGMRLERHELLARAQGALGRRHGATAAGAISAPVDGSSDNGLAVNADVVRALLTTPLASRPLSGSPLVDDWDCLRGMVAAWRDGCHDGAPLDQYSMKHTRLMANLCNAGLDPAQLAAALTASGRCGEHTGTVPMLTVV